MSEEASFVQFSALLPSLSIVVVLLMSATVNIEYDATDDFAPLASNLSQPLHSSTSFLSETNGSNATSPTSSIDQPEFLSKSEMAPSPLFNSQPLDTIKAYPERRRILLSPAASPENAINSSETSTFFCGENWMNSIVARERRNNRTVGRDLDLMLKGLCTSGTPEFPARERRWRENVPSLFPETEVRKSYLDSTRCARDMGDSSKQMKILDFKERNFLMLFDVPEQLSKSRKHFTEAVALAKLTNRVLVLPRVSNSRIGMSRELPLCAYFDTKLLGSYVDWVSYEFYLEMSWRAFGDLTNETVGNPLSIQIICMERFGRGCMLKSRSMTGNFLPVLAALHLLTFPQDRIWTVREVDKIEDGEPNTLKAEEMLSRIMSFKEDRVLVLSKRTPAEIFTSLDMATARKFVNFSPQLLATTDELISILGGANFVSVHVRFERIHKNVKSSALRCSENLILRMKHFRAQHPKVAKIYLASDISPVTFKMNSDTWAKDKLEVVLPYFKNLVKELQPYSAETLFTMGNFTFGPLENLDEGMKAILDKLVCAKAHYFVAGKSRCGGNFYYEHAVLLYRQYFKLPKKPTFRFG